MYLINHDPQMMLGLSQQLCIVCNINIEKKSTRLTQKSRIFCLISVFTIRQTPFTHREIS